MLSFVNRRPPCFLLLVLRLSLFNSVEAVVPDAISKLSCCRFKIIIVVVVVACRCHCCHRFCRFCWRYLSMRLMLLFSSSLFVFVRIVLALYLLSFVVIFLLILSFLFHLSFHMILCLTWCDSRCSQAACFVSLYGQHNVDCSQHAYGLTDI